MVLIKFSSRRQFTVDMTIEEFCSLPVTVAGAIWIDENTLIFTHQIETVTTV